MKRLSALVLLVMVLVVALAACTTTDPHEHSFKDGWCADATNHWLAADCEHAGDADVKFAHSGTTDGKCDVCGYNTFYTVEVDAPANVTVTGDLTTKNDKVVSFTASVSDKYVLTANGAVQDGAATVANGVATYTFKVANVETEGVKVSLEAKQVKFYEEIATGTFSFETIAQFDNEVIFTVDLPAAGTYVIATDNTEVSLNGGDPTLILNVTEAGEVEIVASYFSWVASDDALDVSYTVTMADTFVELDALGGEGYEFATGVDVSLFFTVAEPGTHFFGTSSLLTVNNDADASTFRFTTTTANEKVLISVRNNDTSVSSYEFDWDFYQADVTEVAFGSTEVTLVAGKWTAVSLTCDEEFGRMYRIGYATEATLYENEEYGFYMVYGTDVYLNGGETRVYYAFNYGEEDITTTFNVGDVPTQLNDYELNASASPEGSENEFKNQNGSETEYSFVAPAGAYFSFDGGETWVTEYTTTIEGNGSVLFLVKHETDTTVEIGATPVVYEVLMNNLGDFEFTLKPGKMYTINFGMIPSGTEMLITWNNVDVSITNGGWLNYVSGNIVTVPHPFVDGYLYVESEATEDVTVTFTVAEKPVEPDSGLAVGDNEVVCSVADGFGKAKEVAFTSAEGGSYTASWTTTEDVEFIVRYDDDALDGPYNFTLEAGQSITFIVFVDCDMSTNDGDYTVTLTISENG